MRQRVLYGVTLLPRQNRMYRVCLKCALILIYACWVILHAFCGLLLYFKINFFRKILSGIPTIRVSKSWDPDQARHFVGPDLDPNCLQDYQQTTLACKEEIIKTT